MPRVRIRAIEWLLALLVLRHGRAVDRSWLAGTLWLDSEEDKALHNLRHALVHLRKALGRESARLQSPTRDTLTLDLEGAEVDLLAFDRAIQAADADSLRRAVALYTGPLLEGCYEEWVTLERASREQACLRALETLTELAEKRGDFGEALALLRRAEGMDGLRDSTQRSLMRVLSASGDTPAALMTYREHRLRLRREMNVEPDAETTRLFQQLRAAGKGRQETEERSRKPGAPGLQSTHSEYVALTPLPHPLTTLIGREAAVQELVQQVAASRLVTLVGTGGVGKTRLAIQVAREAAEDFPHGAVFVALASLAAPTLLPSFLASALGIREEGTPEPASQVPALFGWLSTHTVLLVLDNCEHLIETVAELCQTLLERCPRLHILATSRQRLGLTGEVVWRVPSLPAPDPEQLSMEAARVVAVVLQYPAVQLFVERARMAHSGFRLSGPEEAQAVARICQRLDGIPLAIELAAARAGFLTPSQIASRLDDRFQLLTNGSRGALSRHQTLRALIDWSYDLLTEAERALLGRLSVFADGWTLEAAEAVTGVPYLLASLTDKSLVVAQEPEGALRYHMLETVREYALEKLRESGEEAARNQHLAYFLKLAQEIGPALRGSDLEAALERVEAEIGNFRAALAWAQTQAAPPEAHVQLTAALWPYWQYHGLSEGHGHLRTARLRSEGMETSERAQVLLGEARLAFPLFELEEALRRGLESLTLFRRLGDQRALAEALLYTGIAAREKGDPTQAISLLTEGLEEARQCGWMRGCAMAYMNLGLSAMETDPEQARFLMEESRSLAEEAGDLLLTAHSLQELGHLEMLKGDPGRAGSLLERALSIHRRLSDRYATALTLRWLGALSRRQGNLTQAVSYLQEAVAISREQGHLMNLAMSLSECGGGLYEQKAYSQAKEAFTESLSLFRQRGGEHGIGFGCNLLGSTLFHLGEWERARELHREALAFYQSRQQTEGIVWSLERLADVEAANKNAQKAARLLGMASVGREGLENSMDRWDQEDWDGAIVSVRAALGEAEFERFWAEGRTFTLEQAVVYALTRA